MAGFMLGMFGAAASLLVNIIGAKPDNSYGTFGAKKTPPYRSRPSSPSRAPSPT